MWVVKSKFEKYVRRSRRRNRCFVAGKQCGKKNDHNGNNHNQLKHECSQTFNFFEILKIYLYLSLSQSLHFSCELKKKLKRIRTTLIMYDIPMVTNRLCWNEEKFSYQNCQRKRKKDTMSLMGLHSHLRSRWEKKQKKNKNWFLIMYERTLST